MPVAFHRKHSHWSAGLNYLRALRGNLDSGSVGQIVWIYANSASQNTNIAPSTKQNDKNYCFELVKPTEHCEITPLWPHCKRHIQNVSVYHRGKKEIPLLSHMTCQPREQWAMCLNKMIRDGCFTLILYSFHLCFTVLSPWIKHFD